PDPDLSFKPSFEGKPAREITQGVIVVEFEQFFSIPPAKKVLAGDFPGVDRADGNFWLVAGIDHQFCGAANIALAHEQIQVAIAAHRWLAVGPHRKDRPLDHQHTDFFRGESLEKTEQL